MLLLYVWICCLATLVWISYFYIFHWFTVYFYFLKIRKPSIGPRNTESHVHENMESLQLFFFSPFILWTFHPFLLCCFILFPAPECMPDPGSIIGLLYVWSCILCLIGISSISTTTTYCFCAYHYHNSKTGPDLVSKSQTSMLDLSVCLESFLISRYQKLNLLFSLHIFPLPLATNILSVSQAQNLGIRFLSTLSFAFYIQTSSKSHTFDLCIFRSFFSNFVIILVDLSCLYWILCVLSLCSRIPCYTL